MIGIVEIPKEGANAIRHFTIPTQDIPDSVKPPHLVTVEVRKQKEPTTSKNIYSEYQALQTLIVETINRNDNKFIEDEKVKIGKKLEICNDLFITLNQRASSLPDWYLLERSIGDIIYNLELHKDEDAISYLSDELYKVLQRIKASIRNIPINKMI